MKFNQTTNKNDLLTEKYSIAQIEELKNRAESKKMTFSKFKKVFDVQCVRKTHQGYYVVLLLEDDRNAFAFFDDKDTLTRVMVTNGFRSRMEFQNQVREKMPKSKVLNYDTNTIFAATSGVEITIHIVQEGVCIVKYLRFKDREIIEDPTVTSIEFIENKKIPTNEDPYIRNAIPYICEIDKESE